MINRLRKGNRDMTTFKNRIVMKINSKGYYKRIEKQKSLILTSKTRKKNVGCLRFYFVYNIFRLVYFRLAGRLDFT